MTFGMMALSATCTAAAISPYLRKVKCRAGQRLHHDSDMLVAGVSPLVAEAPAMFEQEDRSAYVAM